MDDDLNASSEITQSNELTHSEENLIPLIKQADNTLTPSLKLVSVFISSQTKGLETYNDQSTTPAQKTKHYIEVRMNNQLHRVDCDQQVDVPVEVAEVIQHLNGLE